MKKIIVSNIEIFDIIQIVANAIIAKTFVNLVMFLVHFLLNRRKR